MTVEMVCGRRYSWRGGWNSWCGYDRRRRSHGYGRDSRWRGYHSSETKLRCSLLRVACCLKSNNAIVIQHTGWRHLLLHLELLDRLLCFGSHDSILRHPCSE